MPTGRQYGFTLVATLAALFLAALATQGVMKVLSQQAQREREAELLHIGVAYAEAIRSYYESSPGSIKRWPRTLEELTDDRRFVGIKRHLREAYADPVSRSAMWGLVAANDGGIAGIYSVSEATPLRTASLDLDVVILPAANRYADWKFVYQPAPEAARR